MPNLNCTTPEQSKVLIRLGLNAKTADCYWDYDVQKHEYYPMFMDDQYDDLCIPAWSLGALLELIPKSISEDGTATVYAFSLFPTWSKTWIAIYETADHYVCESKEAETPLEASLDILCWLMKEGYVKDASK